MDTMEREIGQDYDGAPFDTLEDRAKMFDFEESQTKRAPYSVWTVGGVEYKLRLTADVIGRLENEFKKNLLLALTDDGLPPVADMLLTIQGAMQRYHHKMSSLKVHALYDRYVDEGGDHITLMADVIMPLLAASGFFTKDQVESLSASMKDLDSSL